MATEPKDSLHLRVDATVVKAVDALAVVWHTSRNDAAGRLLDEAVGRHIDEIEAGMAAVVARWVPAPTPPGGPPAGD